MAVTPGRRIALETLRAVGRGRRLDLAFADAAGRILGEAGDAPGTGGPGAEPDRGRERRFAQELAYGTVRLRGRLDHLLDHHLRSGLEGVAPPLLDVLRLGAYQLLHMDGVPPYAAVSQSVEQGRAMEGRGAGGLVNAVLRALAREGEEPALFPGREADPAGWLSTWGSHPRWLVERWLDRWPVDSVTSLVAADNRIPPLTLVPLEGSPDAAVERLAEAGIKARVVGKDTESVEVTGAEEGGSADPLSVLAALPAVIQDPGASLVPPYAAFPADAAVADLCAAPGGKSLLLARQGRRVIAADRSSRRLRLLSENVERTGLSVLPVVALAETPPLARAPAVLLDVPCTGTGTLRRHPDARWRLDAGDVARLAAIQARILRGAAAVVPPGGLLVYSTCTLEPEENEGVVRSFLEERPDFRLDPPPRGAVHERYLDGEGFLRVLPQETGFDGAFAARLRRV